MVKKEKATTKKSTLRGSAGEECFGCGAMSGDEPHSIVGVIHERDAVDATTSIDHPTGEPGEDGENYVAVPVCKACHVDPAHRTKNALKVHFFERKGNSAQIGLMLAGSLNLQG